MALNQVGNRLVFENAKAFAASQGYNVSQAVCTQSYVRSEVALSTTVTNYHIPVLSNDTVNGASFNTEYRLALQDIMVVSAIGLYVCKPSSATATNFALFTNPNATVFATGASQLYTLWNSYLNVAVNNQQVIPNMDTFRFYSVPQTQQGVGITAQTVFPIDQMDGSESGLAAIEPNFLLNGASNIQANITLPAAISTIDTNSRIVVMWKGIKLQNVTAVR
jgi:hypothetical protein